jgi:iron complex transport system permease protein
MRIFKKSASEQSILSSGQGSFEQVKSTGSSKSGSNEQAALDTYQNTHLHRRILILVLALVTVALISGALGRYFAPPDRMWTTTIEHFQQVYLDIKYDGLPKIMEDDYYLHRTSPSVVVDTKLESAIFDIRFPRVIVCILVGMALSVAGASYQGMFKNPLVSPDLLGASAGASFGACLAMLLNLPNVYLQLFAFAGGLLAVGLVMMLDRAVRSDALLGLILGGILVGTLFSSGTSIIKIVADADDKLPAITFWLMGSFNGVNLKDMLMLLPVMLIGFSVLLSQRWNLNVLSFGEDEARSLGVNTARTRTLVIIAATLLSASSVAVAGIIGWIGLVVPHLTRAIVGPNYRVLLPTTMLVGSIFLLIVDDFARLIYSTEIPIGLLTSILGVPFFAVIYRRNMKGWR